VSAAVLAMTYDCMTPEEYALWSQSGRRVPCFDCPLWFSTLAREQGKCCRPVQARPVPSRGPSPRYATEAERIEARRTTWRASKRRQRGVQ
jgi:hypothetical protein